MGFTVVKTTEREEQLLEDVRRIADAMEHRCDKRLRQEPLVYLSSSWKNREVVRTLAEILRRRGLNVFDFTDANCRKQEEIPPERFPGDFDPSSESSYAEYINAAPEWRRAVEENRQALDRATACILLLPAGNDAHADWAYAVGRGVPSAVFGRPDHRTPSHLWAELITEDEDELLDWAQSVA